MFGVVLNTALNTFICLKFSHMEAHKQNNTKTRLRIYDNKNATSKIILLFKRLIPI